MNPETSTAPTPPPSTVRRWVVLGILAILALSPTWLVKFWINEPEVFSNKHLLDSPHFRGPSAYAPDRSKAPDAPKVPTGIIAADDFLWVLSAQQTKADQQLTTIKSKWDDSYLSIVLDLARFARPKRQERLIQLLAEKTGLSTETELNEFQKWIWANQNESHPQILRFKALLYEQVDSRFATFFQPSAPKIRIDEIQWGSVAPDGIPPLKSPEMLAANEATFLGDADVVFGISINGDVRCFPKRILAWHEMFEDTIGDTPICGVY